MLPKILFVATSHVVLGETGRPAGAWAEELATPYYAFTDAGFAVDLASPSGGAVPLDPGSMTNTEAPAVARLLADPAATAKLRGSLPIESVRAEDYAALFLPGGHGAAWDLPESGALAWLVAAMDVAGKPVAAVCHGVAGLVGARRADGQPVVGGRRVNSFTDAEETAVGLAATVPFLLESRLRDLGARFEGGPNFQPFAVRDGTLITGQNPASSTVVAQHLLDALGTPAAATAA